MTLTPVSKKHAYLYKMVVAVCLVASGCAVALVHALAAVHLMKGSWE